MSFIHCPYCQSANIKQTESGHPHEQYFQQLRHFISPAQMALFGIKIAKKTGAPPLPLQLTLRGKSTTQSYRQPVYYVDLTLKDGVSLNDAIRTAKEIDQQSKEAGFYQEAVDFVAKQGFANAQFEVNGEEGFDVVDEFYAEPDQAEVQQSSGLNKPDGFVQDIQQGLQRSVRAVN